MATTIEQQVAIDEALVPSTQRLRIGRSNLRLPSDIQSKESTLQLAYDVLRRCPFFKAFIVTADVPEIYMQEFWATAYVVSRHQNTQQYGAMLPIELTNDEIRNTKAYKEYYAFATREAAPKPKASAKRKMSGSDTSITPPTATTTLKTTVAVTLKLTAAAKGKQPAKAKSLSDPSEVARTEAQQLKIVLRRSRQQTHISQPGGSGTNERTSSKLGVPDVPTDESEEELSWNSFDDEGADDQEKIGDDDEGDESNDREESEEDDDAKDKDGDERDDDEDKEITKDDEQDDTERSGDDTEEGESDAEDNDEETRDEENFNPIPHTPESSKDEGDGEEDQGLNVNEEEHVEEEEEDELYRDQESSSVSSQFMTSMLNPTSDVAEVLTRSSHSSRTSYAVAANLSEMELKKILIEKIEGNKSIQRSDEQRNLYKALVDAYEADKIILDSYGETVILKRRRDDDDDEDEGPSAGSDRGSKRRREKEPVQTTSQIEEPSHPVFETGAEDQPIVQSSQHPEWFSQSQKPPTLDRDWNKTLPAVQGSTQTWISELEKQADSRSFFNELLDTPLDFSNFIMNRLRVDTLTPELLAGPTYELMKGSYTSLIKLEYHLEEVYKATTDQLDWVNPEGVSHWGLKRQQFYGFTINRESALDVYSKRRIIAVTDLKILEWHSYKHIDWISVRRDDDKIYTFKEGDFKRLRLQDIEDMLLLLVQGKLSNLTFEERFIFNVSLRMFTRSIVIQRRVEDLQLGVESYLKRLNLTKPDTYRSDLKRRKTYTAYSNPRGFIYQNKDKKNRLMRIDKLHKFSDGTLNDVRTALDDRLKGIRMQYLPQTIWRKGNKDIATAKIQAIDKMLKTRRIMRSLEKFVGERLLQQVGIDSLGFFEFFDCPGSRQGVKDLREESMEYMMKSVFGLRWNFKELKEVVKLRFFRKKNIKLGGISRRVKENQEKDKIGSKPDKNGKRGEARKCQ
nr:hypothetical protein [Tanacetum cinerariifolium]